MGSWSFAPALLTKYFWMVMGNCGFGVKEVLHSLQLFPYQLLMFCCWGKKKAICEKVWFVNSAAFSLLKASVLSLPLMHLLCPLMHSDVFASGVVICCHTRSLKSSECLFYTSPYGDSEFWFGLLKSLQKEIWWKWQQWYLFCLCFLNLIKNCPSTWFTNTFLFGTAKVGFCRLLSENNSLFWLSTHLPDEKLITESCCLSQREREHISQMLFGLTNLWRIIEMSPFGSRVNQENVSL